MSKIVQDESLLARDPTVSRIGFVHGGSCPAEKTMERLDCQCVLRNKEYDSAWVFWSSRNPRVTWAQHLSKLRQKLDALRADL